ncbi:glycoside hydrolase family 73 protein [Vaginisenegalia massiliensis]|uniref:glycoside hydrolase family 73 protein n=1 Tax=Vaginisenegalia massiliensis TaxID=2058294 RepID=UPI000F535F20|nr:glycoside hydrolase family 73 protein [Vaginisenegalia massiliensis]
MPTKRKSRRKYPTRTKMSPRRRKLQRQFNQFMQKVGYLSFFILIFIALIIFLVIRYQNFQPEPTPDPGQEQRLSQAQKEAFVKQLVPIAQRLQREYGILASISLSQAMLESDFGASQLSAEYHNLFGVKTDASDPQGIDFSTKEFVDGEWITIVDRFKVYHSWEESMEEHAKLLYYGTSWNAEYYQDVKQGRDYVAQAKGLQSAGYATDPGYADKIIAMIEEWQLYQYDQPLP